MKKKNWQSMQDRREFEAAKGIIERVHSRLGINRIYTFVEWRRDEQFLEGASKRKQLLRQREAEGRRAFLRWQARQIEQQSPRGTRLFDRLAG